MLYNKATNFPFFEIQTGNVVKFSPPPLRVHPAGSWTFTWMLQPCSCLCLEHYTHVPSSVFKQTLVCSFSKSYSTG